MHLAGFIIFFPYFHNFKTVIFAAVMKLKLFFALLFFTALCASAQTHIADSIRSKIFSAKNNDDKLAAILDYCEQYQSLNKDTAYNYALLALNMAKQSGNEKNIARAELAFANSYYLWGWVDSAEAVCGNALKKYSAANENTRTVYFKLLRQKALCYGGVQKYPEALDVLYKLLRESEQYHDSITIATTLNTIGSVNVNMDKAKDALTWIFTAAKFDTKETGFVSVRAAIYTNTALAYMMLEKYDSAFYFINNALPLCRLCENLNTLATALRIRSNLFVTTHKYGDAEIDLREMIAIRQKLSNYSNLTDDNIQIANFYANTGQLDKAIELCIQNLKSGDAYNTADSAAYSNHLTVKLEYYKALEGFYKQAGMNSEYTKTLEEIIAAKDSFYIINNAQAIAEVQTKYETEQKEKTILQQKYDLAKKNFFIYGSFALLVFAGLIFYFSFKEYRRKQSIKMQLAMEKENAAKLIAVKEAEEKERKRIAADLHDNLGVQANAIFYNTELLKSETINNEILVDDLHDTAKQMLLNLRETLWAMKANDIAATELWLRIINFTKQMGRHYTQIQFATQGVAPAQMQLPSAKALNVVMIVQEAVQNAVKHSGANKIIILSNFETNNWNIIVHDNGHGFTYQNAYEKKDSHGLKNMQSRAESSNLTFQIHSNTAQGTEIEIQIEEKV